MKNHTISVTESLNLGDEIVRKKISANVWNAMVLYDILIVPIKVIETVGDNKREIGTRFVAIDYNAEMDIQDMRLAINPTTLDETEIHQSPIDAYMARLSKRIKKEYT